MLIIESRRDPNSVAFGAKEGLDFLNALEADFGFAPKTKIVAITKTGAFYKQLLGSEKISKCFLSESMSVPKGAFGIALISKSTFMSKGQFKYIRSYAQNFVFQLSSDFWPISDFYSKIYRQKRSYERQQAAKEERERLKKRYKERVKEWKRRKKEAKEAGLDFEEPKPQEPILPEMPNAYSMRVEGEDKSIGWIILRGYRVFKVADKNIYILLKRENSLSFTVDNLFKIYENETKDGEILSLSKEEFLDLLASVDKDDEKKIETIKQPIYLENISVIAQTQESLREIKFSEYEKNGKTEEKIYPPLAPIKPMHAASMLAGGMGSYSREVELDGQKVMIKAAIVKEFVERTTVMGDQEIKETIEFYVQKMGVYEMGRRYLKMLS